MKTTFSHFATAPVLASDLIAASTVPVYKKAARIFYMPRDAQVSLGARILATYNRTLSLKAVRQQSVYA